MRTTSHNTTYWREFQIWPINDDSEQNSNLSTVKIYNWFRNDGCPTLEISRTSWCDVVWFEFFFVTYGLSLSAIPMAKGIGKKTGVGLLSSDSLKWTSDIQRFFHP